MLSHLALQEAQNATNLLQRKTLAAKLRDDGDLNHFFRKINAFVPFVPRRYDFSLVPPLQLTKADLRDLRNIRACVGPLAGRQIRTDFPCFEHSARIPFGISKGSPNCTRPTARVKHHFGRPASAAAYELDDLNR